MSLADVELSQLELEHLSEVSHWEGDAVARYNLYRKRGVLPADAYAGAIAWARNMAEQRARRLAHNTGAE